MYQNLSEEKKPKTPQYVCQRCRNLFEEEKENKREFCRDRYKVSSVSKQLRFPEFKVS